MILNSNINAVAETAFLTLYGHALDAQSSEPILNDQSSIKTIQLLNNKLSQSNKKLHKRLVKGKIDKKLVIHTAIRAKKYDKQVIDFIKRHTKATIVNIGCG